MGRISAAALARVEIDNRYLVGLNRKKREVGRQVYTPYGGVLEATFEGREFLENLGAEFEWRNNLRLYLDDSLIPSFEDWFFSRTQRETSIYRELREELVDEDKVFPILPETVLTCQYINTVTENVPTSRQGSGGEQTQRYLELIDVKFISEYLGMLRDNLLRPDTYLALLTREEIMTGRTEKGIEVGTNCLPLIY